MGHSEMITLMRMFRPERTLCFDPPSLVWQCTWTSACWQPATDTEKSDRVKLACGRQWALRQLINFHLLAKPLFFFCEMHTDFSIIT